MLEYFFNQTSLEEVLKIKTLLNEKKLKLEALNFTDPFKEYKQAEEFFENVKHISIDTQNEQLANATFITSVLYR